MADLGACLGYWRNKGLATWSSDKTGSSRDGTPTSLTETILQQAGVDASRDCQGFLMNRQKDTNAINFPDSHQDKVEVLDDTGFSFAEDATTGSNDDSAFSVTAWIYMNDATSFPIVNKYADSHKEWNLKIKSNDKLYLNVWDNSAGARQGIVYNTALTSYEGQWIHVACTYTGDESDADAGMILYLNGDALTTITDSSGSYTGMEQKTSNLVIGEDSVEEEFADGKIDDLMIYSDVLTAPEVKRNYNAGKRSHR